MEGKNASVDVRRPLTGWGGDSVLIKGAQSSPKDLVP